MFYHQWSAYTHGLSTAIARNGQIVSAVTHHNVYSAKSTATVIQLNVDDQVTVQV